MALAASSSTENKSPVENLMQYYLYPPPIAQFEDVISSPKLFMDVLGKFHAAMGTKFKIPIVGGKDLDLHRLFMEVTSRGGIKKVLDEKKWKEVTNCFSFPPSATNASFILRKYYMSLVHHFEQVYYFKAKAWTPVPSDTWQSTKTTLTSTTEQSPDIQETSLKKQRLITEKESSIGLPVTGVLDGKFENGYLCTVRIGGEQLQGVLYQTVQTALPNQEGLVSTMDPTSIVRSRRRRRKKSEMRKRDPAHPKPNRSGYNFFFAEQHARLKLLHTGKDRAISRMIGEEWNKLTDSQKAVYQEQAVKDKERYRNEMENYREGIKREQVLPTSTPLPEQYFMMNPHMETNGHENETNSCDDDDDSSSFEADGEETTCNVLNLETGADIGHKRSFNVGDNQVDESGQQNSMLIPENEPLTYGNEATRIQENNSKSHDAEPMIPDINDENQTKSADHQEQDLEMFDENGPLFPNEERDLENPR